MPLNRWSTVSVRGYPGRPEQSGRVFAARSSGAELDRFTANTQTLNFGSFFGTSCFFRATYWGMPFL